MNEHARKSRPSPLFFTLVILIPLVYVASVGPVVALVHHLDWDPHAPWLLTFYTPVIWLHWETPLRAPLDLWLRLWGVRDGGCVQYY